MHGVDNTEPQAASSERDLDVRYYGDLLWRARNLIAATCVLGLFLGAVVGFLQTPEYRAGAMVQIDPPTPAFLNVQEAAMLAGGAYWQNADYYNTQFKVLRSSSLGAKVADRLKLKDAPPFKGSPEVGSLVMSHVAIEPIPESRLVMIQVTHEDPKTAALWANTLANVYVEETLSTRVEAARRAYEWLQERLSATQTSMRDAREKLFTSNEGQDLFVPDSGSVATTTLTKLSEDYTKAQARRIEVEAVSKQIAEMRARKQSLDTLPQMAIDPTFSSLAGQMGALSLELQRLREKFKDAHPEVQRVLGETARVRKAMDARAAQVAAGLQAELSQIQKQEAELRDAIEQQKAQAATQSRRATELETLKKEADSANSLYDVLLQKLHETDIAASIRSNNVTIVEEATPPRSPVRPNRKRIALAGALLGAMLGVGLVLGRDYIDNTLKDPDEIERYLHLEFLTAVPRYTDESAHLVTEAYQNLRTALIFGRTDDGGQVVLITSTVPEEGKTTTLVNLAKLLASAGERTLVVDFDLRRASLHHRLRVPREPGITDYFVRHEPIESLIRPTSMPNLFALSAGPLPPSPPAILTRKTLPDLLARLRGEFEWVLLDSPPLASVTDGLLLARHADLAVMVVQHNTVDKKVVKRAVSALRKVSSRLMGVVLNAVDVKAQGYYYYYYQQQGQDAGKRAGRAGPRPVTAARR
jgi:capsular exopolysaccharide synthesis family protein